jgi:hypothetical protein
MIHNVLQPSDAISNLVLYPTLMRGRTYLGSREENGTWINTFEANRFIHENLSPIDEFDPARVGKSSRSSNELFKPHKPHSKLLAISLTEHAFACERPSLGSAKNTARRRNFAGRL